MWVIWRRIAGWSRNWAFLSWPESFIDKEFGGKGGEKKKLNIINPFFDSAAKKKSIEHKMWHGRAINTLLCSAHTPAESDSKMRRNGWICKQPWFRAGLRSRVGACVGAISACLRCSYMCICHAYVRVDGAAGLGLLRHTCVHCARVR